MVRRNAHTFSWLDVKSFVVNEVSSKTLGFFQFLIKIISISVVLNGERCRTKGCKKNIMNAYRALYSYLGTWKEATRWPKIASV